MGILGKHDVETEELAIEVKDRVSCVLFGWMDQAWANAPNGKIPVVVVHKKGSSHDDDIFCIRYGHLFYKGATKWNA